MKLINNLCLWCKEYALSGDKSDRDEVDQAKQALIDYIEGLESELNTMAKRIIEMCKKREWSLHWTHRGAYLHLESSELIEAIRGKHGDPLDEAGDVLLVLMSITENAGIPFADVIKAADKKLCWLEEAPPYSGEEKALPNKPEEG